MTSATRSVSCRLPPMPTPALIIPGSRPPVSFDFISTVIITEIETSIFLLCSPGSVVVEYIAALAAGSSETISSLDATIQSMLMDKNGTFLGPFQLQGTRQNAINYAGKFFNKKTRTPEHC